MIKTIDKNIHAKIKSLANEGDTLTDKGQYSNALWKYHEAIELIEKPRNTQDAHTWLLASVGNVYFLKKNYNKAANALYDALNSAGGASKGFIYLRLGQCLYELDDMEASEENLLKAYMMEGAMIFKEQDRKYINLIKNKLNNHLNITIQNSLQQLHISTPLPIQQQEAVELFEKLEDGESFITLENSQKKVLQFYYEFGDLTVDIPIVKEQGNYQKSVSKDEAKQIIARFFEYQNIPEIENLHFKKW